MKNRIESLDWLRGLMALSIMFYHLIGNSDASTVFGRLGVYGVSIFFILSGLSMAIAYEVYVKDFKTSCTFMIRRLFRILPLLWITIILVVIAGEQKFTFNQLFLNFTTLFSVLKPDAYINQGAWSIGNEMVYYLFTPVIILLYNKKKWLGNLFTAITILIGLGFAFYFLSPSQELGSQWKTYIIPFNNMFLYCCGVAMYYNLKDLKIKNIWAIMIGVVSTGLFVFIPVRGNQINLVTGVNRIIFTIIALGIVFAFYKIDLKLAKLIRIPLEQFGIATYGIYLLHPVVNMYTKMFISNNMIRVGIVIVMTTVLALLSFNFYEKPLMKLGKQWTSEKSKEVNIKEKAA